MNQLIDMSIDTPEELDAVNDVLAGIGESPVNTLEEDSNVDVANARRILATMNRRIQSKGWTFNIEDGAQLVPDSFSKMIPYMPDYLRVLSESGATVYINRGGYVYDTANRTDQFDGAITVNMIKLRTYSEMPECFRSWIVTKAARAFNNRFFGAPEVEGMLQMEEQECYQAVMEYELDYGNFNMLGGDAFVGGLLTR